MRKFLFAILLLTASELSVQDLSLQRSGYDKLYMIMPDDTNEQCNYDGYEELTSEECEAFADHEGITYGKSDTWSDEPKGCHIYKCKAYFNEHPTGNADPHAAGVCKRSTKLWTSATSNEFSIFALHEAKLQGYQVMDSGANSCDDGYEPLTPFECKMYTCSTNRSSLPLSHLYEVENLADSPKGCTISYGEDKVVYFNEHPTGAVNDDIYRPVCKPNYVTCGGHDASSCAVCPDNNGTWMGSAWCNGECEWSYDGICKPLGSVSCGGRIASTCSNCPDNNGTWMGGAWCNGECQWSNKGSGSNSSCTLV